eukprot:scaffold22259_cov112-Isochrysis_galbana.AAC.2
MQARHRAWMSGVMSDDPDTRPIMPVRLVVCCRIVAVYVYAPHRIVWHATACARSLAGCL